MSTDPPIDHRARRAAKRVGLVARKSRRRAGTVDNPGGFQLIDPLTNSVVSGSRFNMSAEGHLVCGKPKWFRLLHKDRRLRPGNPRGAL
jgi:hypothetical protein